MSQKNDKKTDQPQQTGLFYQHLVDLSPNPILTFTPLRDNSGQVVDFACEYANLQAQSAFTMPLTGARLYDLLPSDAREMWLAHARSTLETGEAVSEPLTLATGSKTTPYVATLHPVEGRVVLCLHPDPAQKYRVQMAQNLLKNVPDLIFSLDTEGRFTSVYGRALETMNLTEARFIGKTWGEVQSPAPDEPHMAAYRRVMDGHDTTVDWTLRLEHDQQIFIETRMSPIRDAAGSVIGVSGSAIDITALRRTEQAAHASEERYRAVVDAISDFAYALDVHIDNTVKIAWMTPNYETVTGLKAEDRVKTLPSGAPVHPDDQVITRTATLRAIEQKAPVEADYRIIRQDSGDIRWIHGRLIPGIDPETGRVIRLYGSGTDITERKLAEQALAESEERYRAVVDAVSNYAYSLNVVEGGDDVEFDWLTPRYHDITGYTVKERIVTHPTGPPVHPDDQALLLAAILRAAKIKKPIEVDYRVVHKDTGSSRWIRGRMNPDIDPETGNVIRVYGAGSDITERKLAEQALAESERQMSALLDNLPGMAYRCKNDRNWTMQFVSSGCRELTGYRPDQLIDSTTIAFGDLILPDDYQQVRDDVQAALAVDRAFEVEYRIRCADGQVKTVWERGSGIKQPDGTWLLEGFISDISERRQAQQQRQQAERLLRSTYDNLFDAVLVIDMTTTHIIDCNRAALEMFGYSREEMIDQHANLLQVDDAHGAEFDRLMREQSGHDQIHIAEFPRRRKDGSIFPVEHMMSTIRDSSGAPLYTIATLHDMTARIAAEQERRNLLDMLQNTYNSINDAIFIVDAANGIIESCNRGAETLFGYTQHELVGHQTRLLATSEESWVQARSMLSRDPAQPQTHLANYPVQKKNGEVFPAAHNVTGIYGEPGNIVRWIWVVRDITEMLNLRQRDREQRLFAEELARSAASLNATLDVNQVYERLLTSITGVFPHTAACIMVLEGSQLRVVSVMCDLMKDGYECLDVGHVLPLAHLPAARKVINEAETLTIPNTGEDGIFFSRAGLRWIRSWAGVPLVVNGETVGILNLDSDEVGTYQQADAERLKTFTDQASVALHNALLYEQLQRYSVGLEQAVADRLKELREARTHTEAIFRHNPDGVLMLSPNGMIQQVNPAIQELFGIRPGEVLEKPLGTLLGSDLADEIKAMQDSITAGAASSHREVQLLLRSGVEIDLSIVMAPIHDDNRITGIVCTLRDITELKEVERMKDAFASNVSHELRTPITTITLNQKLIRRNPAKQEEYLARIERETERLSLIVDDLLRLSRLERQTTPINPKPTSLNNLLADFVHDFEPVAQARGLFAELIPHYRDPIAMADTSLIRHVLSILATNAINYTEDGGFTLIVIRDEQRVGFVISDTGPGIAPREQEKVWDRFYRGETGNQSSAQGTGLGLALAREIVRRHNGDIKLDSSGIVGEGTAFTVWLPQA